MSINENEMYLKSIIHDLGMELRTNATCSQIQCFQYGMFNLDHALLSKNWNLANIVKSIASCNQILDKNQHLLRQTHPSLLQKEDVSLIESQERQLLLENRAN